MFRLRHDLDDPRGLALLQRLEGWARELGFSQIGVAEVDLGDAEQGLRAWLEAGFHGSMDYMAAHGMKRARPSFFVSQHFSSNASSRRISGT